MTTLLDIAKLNAGDDVAGLIEEAGKATPEITLMPFRTIAGISYQTKVRTTLPTAGFRNANEGVTSVKSQFENRLVQTFILNPRWECDKAVADRYDGGWEAYLAIEAAGIMQAALLAAARQFYYGTGTGGDAKGYPGLIDMYDATNMVVDAGGTTDDVASSVWAVKFGPQDVIGVVGQGGELEVGDVRVETLEDADGGKFTGYVQELLSYLGLQVGSIHSVGRIKKLTTDSGHGLTDDLVYDLLDLFPAGKTPDVLLMSRRSRGQLRQSRTATNTTGAPAPIPTDVEGIPIVVTEALLDTEKLAL